MLDKINTDSDCGLGNQNQKSEIQNLKYYPVFLDNLNNNQLLVSVLPKLHIGEKRGFAPYRSRPAVVQVTGYIVQ